MDDKTFKLIEKIANEHSNKVFGYLDKEDLKNEIWVICLEKIDTYDISKGNLENYLRVLVKNRMINKFKDITKSVRPPCPRCPFYDPGNSPSDCKEYGNDRHKCSKWRNYILSVESRNSLLNAMEEQIDRENESCIINNAMGRELIELAESGLVPRLYKDLVNIMNGNKVSKQRKIRLYSELKKLLISYDSDMFDHKPSGFIQVTISSKDDKKY